MYPAVHGGDSHLVPVILDAGHHAAPDVLDRNAAGGGSALPRIWQPEAEDVRHGDGPGGNRHDVADHSPHPGVGAAEGLDRRGMVVGFDLEGNIVFLVELHDARVVLEGRDYPWGGDLVGSRLYVAAEDIVDAGGKAGFFASLDVDDGLEGLVEAVLAPCLGYHLEFHVRTRPPFGGEIRADRRELPEIEGCPAFFVEGFQPLVVQDMDGNHRDGDPGLIQAGEGGFHAADGVTLDDGIREKPGGDQPQLLRAQATTVRTADFVSLSGGGSVHSGNAQLAGRAENFIGDGIGHAGMIGDLNQITPLSPGSRAGFHAELLGDRVGKKKTPEKLELPGRHIPAHKVNFRAHYGADLL